MKQHESESATEGSESSLERLLWWLLVMCQRLLENMWLYPDPERLKCNMDARFHRA